MEPHRALASSPHRQRRRWSMVLAVLALSCIAARWAWEIRSPLHFSTVKSVIYLRDGLTLGPATLFAVAAVLAWPASQRAPKSDGSTLLALRSRSIVAGAAILVFAACAAVAHFGLLGVPHVVDEAAYLWQGQVLSHGHLTSATPAEPASSLVQYVADVHGHRASVFFPGSSLPLAVGHALGSVTLVDPILAGLLVVVTSACGRRLFDRRVAIVGTLLFATSPFLLFQGASFFGHVWTALLIVPAFTFGWRSTIDERSTAAGDRRSLGRQHAAAAASGFLCSAALFSRPVSALVLGAVLLAVWARRIRPPRALFMHAMSAAIGAAIPTLAFLAANDALTGRALTTVHRIALPHETAQFNVHGVGNAIINLVGLSVDFSGLTFVGLAFVGLAAFASFTPVASAVRARTERPIPGAPPLVLAIIALGVLQLACYALYYNNGVSYGPRYLFEVTPLLALAAGYGIVTCPNPLVARRAPALIALALIMTATAVAPGRIAVFHQRAEYVDLEVVQHVVARQPGRALVLVAPGPYRFPDPFYAAFVHNGDRIDDRTVLYLRDAPDDRCRLVRSFPDRRLFLLDLMAKAQHRPTEQIVRPLDLSCGTT